MIPSSKALRHVPGRSAGITLIELMVVVVIIAILAAVAIPSYRDYIIRGNRSAAQQFILTIANRQEQFRLDARSYASLIGAGAGGLGLTAPPELATRYTFSMTNDAAYPNATTYTITATPVAGSAQERDLYEPIGSTNLVGPLTLDNLGTKAPADKWKK